MRPIVALIALCFFASCAPKTTKVIALNYPKPFEFELIDTLSGSKDDLYVKAHEWISKTYGSAKTVIDMQDKEAGKIIGKAVMSGTTSGEVVRYVMTIDVKEGRYRCVVSDFNHEGYVVSYSSQGKPYVKSYGDLSPDKRTYISQMTGKPVEDNHYYKVKNDVMLYSQSVLKSLQEKMHSKTKDF